MSDHNSVQQAQTAAASKVKEITEAAIRLLLQQRAKGQEPSPEQTNLYKDFYQAYRDKGVDRNTAKAAAADAALGLGSKDSPMMRQAEAQIERKAQQAQTYQSKIATAADVSKPTNERLQAVRESKDLEASLGITGRTPEEKAEVVSHFEPKTKEPKPSVQSKPGQTAAVSSEVEKEALRQDYQNGYEQRGVRPETAKAAIYEVVNKAAGAADGPAAAQAHQEIRQHQVLKEMYKGIYEKNGVSPEVASQAADQLARGNGANRSNAVRQAHDQALANIGKGQQVPTAQTPQPVAEKNNTNQSPETRQVAGPIPVNARQSAPSIQVSKPIPKAQKDQTSESKPTQDRPTPKIEQSILAAAQASDPLWQRHSPTEQGAGTPGVDYKNNSDLSDKRFAYNALSAGANKADIQQSIIRNSLKVRQSNNPEQYASQAISQAEQALTAARGQQQQTQPATTARPETTEQKASEQVIAEEPKRTTEPTVESGRTQNSARSQNAVQQNGSSPKPTSAQAQPVASAQKLTPEQIYSKFSTNQGTGVFANVSKKNTKLNDLAVAQGAIAAGIEPKDVETAIAKNSPHAKTLKGAATYSKRTVGKAQKMIKKDSKETQPDQQKRTEKGQSKDQARQPKGHALSDQPGEKAAAKKQKTQKKVKSKSRDRGMDM